MLYTRKGDGGTTKLFRCADTISKGSAAAETLGALDELNSFLGLCKIRSSEIGWRPYRGGATLAKLVKEIQQNIFIIQAEVAGADKTIKRTKISRLEKIIDKIENEMPPIKSFSISGGTELAVLFDFARAMARRAERVAVRAYGVGEISIGKHTKAYLNRLSSVLYAMARISNFRAGAKEESPNYL